VLCINIILAFYRKNHLTSHTHHLSPILQENENNYQIVGNYSTTVEEFSPKSKDLLILFNYVFGKNKET
jgi:hypothetical protein